MNDSQKRQLAVKVIECIQSSKDDVVYIIKTSYKEYYEDVIDTALLGAGFPTDDANYENVEHEFNIGMPSEDTIISFFESHLESILEEPFEVFINDSSTIEWIAAEIAMSGENEIIIKQTADEWLEENPTKEYLSKLIETTFSQQKLEQVLKETLTGSNDILEIIEEKMKQEQYPEHIKPSDIDYELTDIKLSYSFEEIGERYSKDMDGDVTKPSEFVKDELYTNIIDDALYEYDVKLLTDASDIDSQYDAE